MFLVLEAIILSNRTITKNFGAPQLANQTPTIGAMSKTTDTPAKIQPCTYILLHDTSFTTPPSRHLLRENSFDLSYTQTTTQLQSVTGTMECPSSDCLQHVRLHFAECRSSTACRAALCPSCPNLDRRQVCPFVRSYLSQLVLRRQKP